MSDDQKEDDMPNWTDLVNNHTEKADTVKVAVGCALKHVTEALFDLVVRNEWRKVHGEYDAAEAVPSSNMLESRLQSPS